MLEGSLHFLEVLQIVEFRVCYVNVCTALVCCCCLSFGQRKLVCIMLGVMALQHHHCVVGAYTMKIILRVVVKLHDVMLYYGVLQPFHLLNATNFTQVSSAVAKSEYSCSSHVLESERPVAAKPSPLLSEQKFCL